MTMMRPYPIPSNDGARSQTVDVMALAERRDDPFFGYVTDMLKHIFKTPVAFISLFSGDRQTFLRMDGIDLDGTPREVSLCAFTVAAKSTIILPDTHADPRSRAHPVVTGIGVRFSASAPVITASGFCLGTVCAVDLCPHQSPSAEQIAMLDTLALMVARYYEQPLIPDTGKVQQLRDIAQNAQKEFLALIGHEMRTPLNAIHGMAQVLEPQNDDDAEVIGAILSSAEHLTAVVSSILSFTELSSGDIQLNESEADLDRIVRKVAPVFDRTARMQGKTITVESTPQALALRADVAKLELALACLVSNFVSHGGNACHIATAALPDGSLSVAVSDNGPGITPAFQAHIWQAFGVGGAVHTRQADGIGLGLPLTRRIVELHGGELDLLCTDAGMTALIRLPAWRVPGA